jgi:hypothetical protein
MEPDAEKAEIREANNKVINYRFSWPHTTQPEPTDREKAIESLVRGHFQSLDGTKVRSGLARKSDFIPEHDSKSKWPIRISGERITAVMPKSQPPMWVNQALMRIRSRGEEGPPIGPLEIIEELRSMRKEWEDIKDIDDGSAKIFIANIKAEEKRIRAEEEQWLGKDESTTSGPAEKAYEALLSPRELAAHKKRTNEYFENRRTTSKNGGKSKKRTGRLHKKYKKKTNKRRTHRK